MKKKIRIYRTMNIIIVFLNPCLGVQVASDRMRGHLRFGHRACAGRLIFISSLFGRWIALQLNLCSSFLSSTSRIRQRRVLRGRHSSWTTLKPCSPLYGAIDKRADQLRRYIKEHVSNSFEYLLQKYGVPPVGKARAESEISSLAKVLDLHKQLAISGNALHEDSIKHDNVKYASEAKEPIIQHNHDIELAHFIEEKFSGKHAQTVRDLAGHSNDLQRLLKEGGRDDKRLDATGFYVHLFDEYLRKIY
ncbi:unnamed protein product [Nesidiocoris tenuis]|uniref:Uncharacterized protein n=1 Tax=Nesidiocoris tenuis TaxID=355587 RepID=A0A6H5G200_9HEMI|nr:unnamed protein product [Nesidiocoris tenuis]